MILDAWAELPTNAIHISFTSCIFNLSLIYALNDDAIHNFIEGQPCFKHLREAGNVTYMQLGILSWEPNTNSFQCISSFVLEVVDLDQEGNSVVQIEWIKTLLTSN